MIKSKREKDAAKFNTTYPLLSEWLHGMLNIDPCRSERISVMELPAVCRIQNSSFVLHEMKMLRLRRISLLIEV